MKALFFQSKGGQLNLVETDKPVPAKNEVLVKLKYAAFNHLDLWIWKEQVLPRPVIQGADGSGIVEAVGENADPTLIGKEVIINPSLNWGPNEDVQGDQFEIIGELTNGTFAEYISIPQEYVYEKPEYLSLKEAAAIPLAGITAYRAAFTKARIKPADKVLITGIGGAVALFLLQLTVAAGCEVYVTSSSEEKIRKAIALGAKGGFNYKTEGWKDEAGKIGFDAIFDSAGGNGFAALTEVANPAARIIVFGRTAGNINNLRPGMIFNKQLQIMGTLMGTRKEFSSLLQFFNEHQIHPVLDREFKFDEIVSAYEYMDSGSHSGKIIVSIS